MTLHDSEILKIANILAERETLDFTPLNVPMRRGKMSFAAKFLSKASVGLYKPTRKPTVEEQLEQIECSPAQIKEFMYITTSVAGLIGTDERCYQILQRLQDLQQERPELFSSHESDPRLSQPDAITPADRWS